jgi:hypothetical protein
VTLVGSNLDKARKALLAVGSLTAEQGLDDPKIKAAIAMLAEDLVANWISVTS